MKKKIQTLVGGLALAAIVGVNGYMVIPDNALASELKLDGLENMAEGENPPFNGFFGWFSQGLRQDEREMPYVCPITNGHYIESVTAEGTGSAGGDNYQVSGSVTYNYSDSHDYAYTYTAINCATGYQNCTRVKCK